MTARVVIVFLKAPEKGRVKTRLSRFLNPDFVLELYKGFVGDTLEALSNVQDKMLYFWPPEKKGMLENWLGNGYAFSCQKGDDIGKRMSNAFQDVFAKGYTRAVLIGVDIPELSRDIITLACQKLQTSDAVIGPSSDGGYYLIGFDSKGFSSLIFRGIDWSTNTVLDQTVQVMNRLCLKYELLPELNDIDTPKDLKALSERVKKGGRTGRRTRKNITEYEG